MLSSDYDTKVRINKRELLDCIDRATLLVKEGDKKPIIMNITEWQYGASHQFIYRFHELRTSISTKDGKE